MPPTSPQAPGSIRLDRLRGSMERQDYSARKITALTVNPGCERRAVLDAAGIDKSGLAARLGPTAPFGQSPFAITRQRAFEEQLKANGYAELITLLRAELEVPVAEAAVADLNTVGENAGWWPRAGETRRLLGAIAADHDARVILDHPVLTLNVAGTNAYLVPDAVSHRIGDHLYIVVIKSFAAVDGQADAGKVAEAAKQAAVYVLALRSVLSGIGVDPTLVAEKFLLVLPKDFANRPYGRLVDLRQQLDAVRHQLARLGRVEERAATLPPEATLDLSTDPRTGHPTVGTDELVHTVEALPHLYGPRCLDMCELSRYCRDAALRDGDPAHLGSVVRDSLPGLASTAAAYALARGELNPSAAQEEVAALLGDAVRLRTLRLAGGAA
ncbi:hypothetical protein [Streptomyces liliifuscus]|uniref:Secreted protein n=1 Tax=Streptomyces liliifuscus TaxID=2797636 RepID=A0A7T7KZH8_9ACTN|nr:hypothetical protein [Streptomyces liliifuscus]QQM43682.1 hypothetical protein JEQ17_32730 [Streptomyces liliifuscus]